MTRGSTGLKMHIAIVTRAVGILAVVAIKRAARLIKTGHTVTVDGMTWQARVE